MQRKSRIGSIKVVLVEDEILVRSLLRELLEATGNIDVIGEAVNGEDAVRLVKKRSREVVVLDINLPGIGAVEATRVLRRLDESIRLLALSPNVDPSASPAASRNGHRRRGHEVELPGRVRGGRSGGPTAAASISMREWRATSCSIG